MKTRKVLGLVPLLFALLVTGAVARDYGKSGSMLPGAGSGMIKQQPMGVQPLPQSGMLGGRGEGVYYQGTLTSINPDANQFTIRTQVPGLLGPQAADVSFTTNPDTTMTICFRSINACDTYFAGERGWDVLSSLEDIDSLASLDKNVLVIGNPDTNEVVHVQIDYGV